MWNDTKNRFDIVARYQLSNFYTNCTKLSLQLLNLEISIVKIQSINLSSVPEIVIRVIPTHTQRLTSNWGKGKVPFMLYGRKKGLFLWMEGGKSRERSIEITGRKRVEKFHQKYSTTAGAVTINRCTPCAPTHRLHAPSVVRMRVSRVERNGGGGQRYAAVGGKKEESGR